MHKKTRLFTSALCAFIATMLTLTGVASAADYPERPITLIIPFAAGGGTDTQARIAGTALERLLGKPLTVVNKTGGKGVIGFSEIAAAKPNGYTLGCLAYPDVVIPPQYKKTPYKTDDFVYLASFNSTPTCLLLRVDAPYKTLKEFIAYAKSNPKRVTVAIASDSHLLSLVMLCEEAGIETSTVAYNSGSEALNALLGGHVDAAMIAPQFGRIALQEKRPVVGMASAERIKAMPDVPTFKEQGFDVVMMMHRVFVAPKGTPAPMLEVLFKACDAAAKDQGLIANVEKAGDEYSYMAGPDLDRYIETMNKRFFPVVQRNSKLFSQ